MTISMQTDVLIVGGAAIGSAAAFFLASQPDFKGKIHVIEQDFLMKNLQLHFQQRLFGINFQRLRTSSFLNLAVLS